MTFKQRVDGGSELRMSLGCTGAKHRGINVFEPVIVEPFRAKDVYGVAK